MITYLLNDKSFQRTKTEDRVEVCSFLATSPSLLVLYSPVKHSSNHTRNWEPEHCPAPKRPGVWHSCPVTSCRPIVWHHYQQNTVTGIQIPQLLRKRIL